MLSHSIWTEREHREGGRALIRQNGVGEMHTAGISHFGPIMESHYQSESCPGRPNEAPHGEGWPFSHRDKGGRKLVGLTKRERRRDIKSISRRRCVRAE